MKKTRNIVLTLLLSCSLAACGTENQVSENVNILVEEIADVNPSDEMTVVDTDEEKVPEVIASAEAEEEHEETYDERLERLSATSDKVYNADEMNETRIVGDIFVGNDDSGYKFCIPDIHKEITDENGIYFRQDFYKEALGPDGVDLGKIICWVIEAHDEDAANIVFWNVYMALWNELGAEDFADTESFYLRQIVVRVKDKPSTVIFALPAYITSGINRDGSTPADQVPDWFNADMQSVLDNAGYNEKYGDYIKKISPEIKSFISEYKPLAPVVKKEKKTFTLEDWYNIPENKKFFDDEAALHTGSDGVRSYSCKNNTLTIIDTFSKETSEVMKMLPKEFLQESFSELISQNVNDYKKMIDNFQAEGVEGKITIRVKIDLNDGTELWSKDITK